MFALLVDLCFDCTKEEPERSECTNSRGPGRVDRLRAVNDLPFFMEIGMYVGCTNPLQDFFEAIVMFSQPQSYCITNRRSTG
jgi:hypothetical protein